MRLTNLSSNHTALLSYRALTRSARVLPMDTATGSPHDERAQEQFATDARPSGTAADSVRPRFRDHGFNVALAGGQLGRE
jgi:hypothetical protein